MVGLDENDYSDIALQWMLEELVDDGDEIICLRVIEKDSKIVSDRNLERRQYQKEARALMEQIQAKNDDSRAIGIVLEFAVGKLHATFQKMVRSCGRSLRCKKLTQFWCRYKFMNRQCLLWVHEVEALVVSRAS